MTECGLWSWPELPLSLQLMLWTSPVSPVQSLSDEHSDPHLEVSLGLKRNAVAEIAE